MADEAPCRRVRVVHGPNLNLLGRREPETYGTMTLAQLDAALEQAGNSHGLVVDSCQENSEGAIIDRLHEAATTHGGVIINPGGYTHTSVAIRDALAAIDIPAIEVHLSNIFSREPFRHTSITGSACIGVVMGLGPASYQLALSHMARLLMPVADR